MLNGVSSNGYRKLNLAAKTAADPVDPVGDNADWLGLGCRYRPDSLLPHRKRARGWFARDVRCGQNDLAEFARLVEHRGRIGDRCPRVTQSQGGCSLVPDRFWHQA